MASIADFNALGQAIWCDYLRRSFIESGELEDLIHKGLSGVTSNPTIFEKALSGSTDYDADLRRLTQEGRSIRETYEALVLEDISRTADLFRPVWDATGGGDGYVSVEVDPGISNDSKAMVDEARRFFKSLNRPNVMIKIPATEAGFSAIRALTAEGINVNVTLIFSLEQYEAAANAYISGLEELSRSGGDLHRVSSVASFFVSRVTTHVDKQLEEKKKQDSETAEELKGKIGIANAKIVYAKFREIFAGERWEQLKSNGARIQRVLWASTSTKNPDYSDTLYVDNLVGPETVNTLPPKTIRALWDHGRAEETLASGLAQAREEMKRLADLGIDFEKVTSDLEDEGIEKFSKSIDSLFNKIAQKRERLLSAPQGEPKIIGGQFQSQVDSELSRLASELVVRRIWNRDHTVWKSDPAEISNRLGWLDAPEVAEENLHRIEALVEGARSAGYTHALLLGMGGSSLAPRVFSKTFGTILGNDSGFLELSVLDSTDPAEIESRLKGLDLARTLFVVSTKSGKTIETLSLFKFFYNKELESLGGGGDASKEKQEAGNHFVAITDPNSPLEQIADRYSFRAKFLNDPAVGGRYSALTYFGLVPAALIGVDLRRLLDNAETMGAACESSVEIRDNPGAWLGAIIGGFAARGRNKVTLVASPEVKSLCDWIEQLLAESTGKEGSIGILPVVGEQLGSPSSYSGDRLFVSIQMGNDSLDADKLNELESHGFPVVRLQMRDPYDLGSQFFQWELATAIAGRFLGVNPFDQPNVESSKELARKMVSTYVEKGTFPPETPYIVTSEGVKVFGGNLKEKKKQRQQEEPGSAILDFVRENMRGKGAYISLQAYLQETPETTRALQQIRTELRDGFKLATTLGYGPRFLHSTGQLHKGDSGLGLFLQFTCDETLDLPIPDEAGSQKSSVSFGVLERAEALGDRRALEERGRNVLRIDLGRNVEQALGRIRDSIAPLGRLEAEEEGGSRAASPAA